MHSAPDTTPQKLRLSKRKIEVAITRKEFETSVHHYGRKVAITAVGAFGLFDCILCAFLYGLGPNLKPLRARAFAFGPVGEILFALSFISAGLAIPVALLVFVVRRANRDPNIRCPVCRKHLWDKKIIHRIMTVGRCPRCEHQLFPEMPEASSTKTTHTGSFIILVASLCGFGILFIATAFAKPAPESYVYWGVAGLNFLIAGRIAFRQKRHGV